MAQDQPDQYFIHSTDLRVIICKQCQHGVWPTEVSGHLKGPQHRVKRAKAKVIQDQVQAWDVIKHPSQFERIGHREQPVEGLPIHADGLRCRQPACGDIYREETSMKKHFGVEHPGARGKRGKGSNKAKGTGEELWEEKVACQQLFKRLKGSNYFSVKMRAEDLPPSEDAIAQDARLVREARQRARERRDIVEENEAGTEVTPWLERVGWPRYLKGIGRKELLALIAPPDEESEPLVSTIWKAMDELVKHCQHTVVTKAGYYMRMEVVRTEKAQTKYRPLQRYMDRDSVTQHALPWKQMVAMFVRTRGREQEEPRYKFNKREEEELSRMVRRARGLAKKQGRQRSASSNSSGGESAGTSSSGGSGGSSSDVSVSNNEPGERSIRVSGLLQACLRFCIALLARKAMGDEYGLPLICAMAVLGVKGDKWATPENYPPVMSRIIKVAKFMLIQLMWQDVEENWEALGLNEPDVLTPTIKFMDEFMIRGSRAPMQWILDTRAYGRKIHYSTTAAGHVD